MTTIKARLKRLEKKLSLKDAKDLAINNLLSEEERRDKERASSATRVPAQCFHPGEFVKDEMTARGWDVAELAKRMSVHDMPVEIAQSIIDCRQDITPNIAFGLRRAFGTSVDFWMNAQNLYDLWRELRQSDFWKCEACGEVQSYDKSVCWVCDTPRA